MQVTVLLSTNIGFLAIQSIDNEAHSSYRSAAQVLSYISTMFSLASCLVYWILLRQHSPGAASTANHAVSAYYALPFTFESELSLVG